MLDVLRKHASSWMIKFILGAIIISFAFFFGYNRMTRARRAVKGLTPGEPVATVNGVEISDTEYRFFYDRNLDRLKASFKGEEMAEGIQKFAQTLTLQQLIQRELMLQTASRLGIKITDEQLAGMIRKNPELIKDGEFDPIFYRHQYLPYFENRFGINYEELVRQDLAIQTLGSLFANVDARPAPETESILWTFEVVQLSPEKLVEQKIAKDLEEAKSIAKSFVDSKDWKGLARKIGADLKTVGPLAIAEREKILNGRGSFEDYQKIFALNSAHQVIDNPIESGDAIFVVRFVEKKASPVNVAAERKYSFLDSWLREQMKKAKIVTYLQSE
jgi:hypothetical protein